MAVTIVRTPWVDDDGTGTTGTVINNAVKTALYNDIDGALAKVAQLAGGNTFTGNQTIAGLLTVTGFGTHVVQSAGTGMQTLLVQNQAPGATNSAQVAVGNDVSATLGQFTAFSSTYGGGGLYVANGVACTAGGAGGLTVNASHAAGVIRFGTAGVERARFLPTGELLVNIQNPVGGGMLTFGAAGGVNTGLSIVNSAAAMLAYAVFYNNASAVTGVIQQVTATTVAYNTTSDARLKDDAGRATDVGALRAVVVHDFAWKADGIRDRGIFAQEAHPLYPRAVSPGTDETTERGDLARPWMTDYSKFVPDLIVGWQQHDADLAELRAQLATLKGSH